MPVVPSRLVFIADIAGTALFAIEGATTAIRADLDLLGVLVLAFATALGGGVIRDVLIGSVPPSALRDWRYPAVAFVAGGVTFVACHTAPAVPPGLIVGLDAAGLGFFAVAGAEKALQFGIQPFIAVLLGTVTGVGGGTLRDVLLAQIPGVLRVDVYATAALAGSAALVVVRQLGLRPAWAATLGGTVCFVLRMLAVWLHWNLPHAGAF